MDLKLETVSNIHYDELIEFLTNFEDEIRDSEFWRSRLYLWWDQNPAFSDKIEKGWVLTQNDNDKIVGFIGNIPTYFHFQRKKIIIYNATSWRVNNTYRNQSLSLIFKAIGYSKDSMLFDTTPSDKIINILKKLKFKQCPILINHTFFNLLNPYNILRAREIKGKLLLLLVKFVSPILKIYQSIRFMHLNKVNIVRRLSKADSQFDTLWEKTKNKYENTNVRTSDIINWYCFGNINFKKILFGYFANDELQAYAIFNIASSNNIKRLVCTDLWGININKKIVKSFVSTAMKYGYENKIDIIDYSNFDNNLSNIYSRLGLFRRSTRDKRYIKTSVEKYKAFNRNDTYLTFFQGDLGL